MNRQPGVRSTQATEERGGVVVEYAIVLAFLSLVLIAGAIVVTNAVNAYWPMVANSF